MRASQNFDATINSGIKNDWPLKIHGLLCLQTVL